MSTSNGIITKPVSIKDVQQTIGNASGDLGTLCKSSTINKWSKIKPVSYAKLFNMTEADYAAVNFGFKIIPYTHPSLVYKDVVSGAIWEYIKPTGGMTSPYRLEDFIGYNHSSSQSDWYTISGTGAAESGTRAKYTTNLGLDWMVKTFGTFSAFLSGGNIKAGQLFYGLIIVPTSSSSPVSVYYYPIGDLVDYSDPEKSISFLIPSDLTAGSSYYIIPVITTASLTVDTMVTVKESDLSIGSWYGMASGRATLTITVAGQAVINATSISLESGLNYSVTGTTVTLNSMKIDVYNGSSESVTYSYVVNAIDANTILVSDNITIAAGTTGVINLSGKSYTSATMNPSIRIDISYKSATTRSSWKLSEEV